MCHNSCVAYTGPYAILETCPECGASRYDPIRLAASHGRVKVPQQTFSTMPVGPQLQALYRHPDAARAMAYRSEKTKELLKKADANGVINVDNYDDIFCGQAYFEAHEIDEDDTVIMVSIDGAQLYRSKQSDAWIAILVILDLSPEVRYKMSSVMPSFVIPGPRKPKNIESFFFPSLHHLAAIQKHGL
ncbi:uncharacterized protein SCHCODRAFT_02484953, partial [Schizophyllum commune H4-8]|uniref:uncharacterized protein n=1 Tax=Schizophyllum commune (strain H4-8 / FGSC 9210) TaxID=578458 RepID=UPI00215E8C25